MKLNRRDVMKMSVMGGAALALPLERAMGDDVLPQANRIAESALPAPFTLPFKVPPVISPVRKDATTDYYRVSMEQVVAEVIPGYRTPLWGYNGSVPGPTFKVSQGRRTVVRHINNLPARHPDLDYTPWTSVHLHGSASLPEYDGYANDISNPGQWKDYRYPNWQPARTLWYHDHGVHHTAQNVVMGLAGMYQLHDPLEQSLPIPQGDYDVPLIVGDTMFANDGKILFSSVENKGFYGDVITVNGTPWPVMKVARRKYRFRVLNAATARSFKWSLSNGAKMAIIATDAGLMPAPVRVPSFRHSAGERYEVIIDFAAYPPGTTIDLLNTSPKNNVDYTHTNKVMRFEVTDMPFSTKKNAIPASLFPAHPAMTVSEADAVTTRRFDFVRTGGLWTINGKTWDDVVASGFTSVLASPKAGSVEIWELRNLSGGWHHPAHIHYIDFKVLSRNGRPPMPHERGGKDVVFLGEYETVKVLIKFEHGRGKYMMHCHNLSHEDHDMMGQFEIVDDVIAAHDPMDDYPRPLPEGDL